MRVYLRLYFSKFIISLFALVFFYTLNGQVLNNVGKDSILHKIRPVNIADIPILSGEKIVELQRTKESISKDFKVVTICAVNDSMLSVIDTLLLNDEKIELESQSTRYLSNKVINWKKYSESLGKEISFFTDALKTLGNYSDKINNDKLLWESTRKDLTGGETEAAILKRVDQLLLEIEQVKNFITTKQDSLLVSLSKTTESSLLVDEFINKVDQVYTEKKKEIFVQNEPSIFSIDYSNPRKTSFIEPVRNFYNTEVKDMIAFISKKVSNLIIQIIFLILLVLLFIWIKNKLNSSEFTSTSFYRSMLVKIMSRSISAAITLGVFIFALLFPDRPELLKDIITLLIILPVVLIGKTFVDKRFHNYLYLFGVLMILDTVYIVFPTDNLYYILILLIASIIEIYVLWQLIRYYYHNPYPKHFINALIIIILLANISSSILGFTGLLYGSTTLAELTIHLPINNAFSGLLIFSIIIIINGLVSFAVENPWFRKLNVIRIYGKVIKKWVISIINICFSIMWLLMVLTQVNAKRYVVDSLIGILTREIKLGEVEFTLGSILMFIVVIWLSIIISRIIRTLLEYDILDKFHMSKGVPHTIALMVRYSIITIGVLLAVTAAGFPISSLTVLAGAFGVGIGFGLQNIFNNIVSGFILLFERPIQIGDTIEVGELIGEVKSIGIRSSNVKTIEGADVIVPNGQLISNEVVNWTLSDQRRRIEVTAGVAYGSDPHKVKDLFEKVLKNHKDILDDPSPSVFFQGLGDSSLDFRLLFWTSNYPEWIRIRSDIVFGVHDILTEEGISIPYPQMDLHLRSIDKPVNIIQKDKKTK